MCSLLILSVECRIAIDSPTIVQKAFPCAAYASYPISATMYFGKTVKVYRCSKRYSQFRRLYEELGVIEFRFPRKTVFNRSPRLLEIRRHELSTYMNSVYNAYCNMRPVFWTFLGIPEQDLCTHLIMPAATLEQSNNASRHNSAFQALDQNLGNTAESDEDDLLSCQTVHVGNRGFTMGPAVFYL